MAAKIFYGPRNADLIEEVLQGAPWEGLTLSEIRPLIKAAFGADISKKRMRDSIRAMIRDKRVCRYMDRHTFNASYRYYLARCDLCQ